MAGYGGGGGGGRGGLVNSVGGEINGGAGTFTSAGTGYSTPGAPGAGGPGGSWGNTGPSGSSSSGSPSPQGPGGAGGASGNAISNSAGITYSYSGAGSRFA